MFRMKFIVFGLFLVCFWTEFWSVLQGVRARTCCSDLRRSDRQRCVLNAEVHRSVFNGRILISYSRILISSFEESWFPVAKCWFYNTIRETTCGALRLHRNLPAGLPYTIDLNRTALYIHALRLIDLEWCSDCIYRICLQVCGTPISLTEEQRLSVFEAGWANRCVLNI